MQCDYFNSHSCRSCTLMGVPYTEQLRDLEHDIARKLGSVPGHVWEPTVTGPETGFRNKAKLAVGGQRGALTLGILSQDRLGVDLRDCGLYEPGLAAAIHAISSFVNELGLTPYDVRQRSGEFKHLIVTHSPAGELMLRFVLRSEGQLGRLQRAWPDLIAVLPNISVGSVNLLPEPVARLEGKDELPLTQNQYLTMTLPQLTLLLGPRGFFQTNTAVASQLYDTASAWVASTDSARVVDLFCGVGGFGLHVLRALPHAALKGIELSADAVEAAQRAAGLAGLADRAFFEAADAGEPRCWGTPDLLIVNPPRRGLGPHICRAITNSSAKHVLYSSCNANTLAADLVQLPEFTVIRAQIFDMFPQTAHNETLVLLSKAPDLP